MNTLILWIFPKSLTCVDEDSYDENREISNPEITDDFEDIPIEHDREGFTLR